MTIVHFSLFSSSRGPQLRFEVVTAITLEVMHLFLRVLLTGWKLYLDKLTTHLFSADINFFKSSNQP